MWRHLVCVGWCGLVWVTWPTLGVGHVTHTSLSHNLRDVIISMTQNFWITSALTILKPEKPRKRARSMYISKHRYKWYVFLILYSCLYMYIRRECTEYMYTYVYVHTSSSIASSFCMLNLTHRRISGELRLRYSNLPSDWLRITKRLTQALIYQYQTPKLATYTNNKMFLLIVISLIATS